MRQAAVGDHPRCTSRVRETPGRRTAAQNASETAEVRASGLLPGLNAASRATTPARDSALVFSEADGAFMFLAYKRSCFNWPQRSEPQNCRDDLELNVRCATDPQRIAQVLRAGRQWVCVRASPRRGRSTSRVLLDSKIETKS